MKIRLRKLFNDLTDKFMPERERNQGKIQRVKESGLSEDVFSPCKVRGNDELLSDSDRHALELRRRGVIACPHYSDFFEDNDVRIY